MESLEFYAIRNMKMYSLVVASVFAFCVYGRSIYRPVREINIEQFNVDVSKNLPYISYLIFVFSVENSCLRRHLFLIYICFFPFFSITKLYEKKTF